MTGIIDIGSGNIGSIKRMLDHLSIPAIIVTEKKQISECSRIIFPGMGSFDRCVELLQKSGLLSELEDAVLVKKIPFLGICVGMQLLMQDSAEGSLPGLGWIKGHTVKFSLDKMYEPQPIPHLGWREVQITNPSLIDDSNDEQRFYFAHSYHVVLDNNGEEWMRTDYGYSFTAAIHSGNIYAVQFHPEKSHRFGMQLLRNFAELA